MRARVPSTVMKNSTAPERALALVHEVLDLLRRAERAPDSPVNTFLTREMRRKYRRAAGRLRRHETAPRYRNLHSAEELAEIYERTAQRDEMIEQALSDFKRLTLALGRVMEENGPEVKKAIGTFIDEAERLAEEHGPGSEAARQYWRLQWLGWFGQQWHARRRRPRLPGPMPPLSMDPSIEIRNYLTAAEILDSPPAGETVVAIPPEGSGSGRERAYIRIGLGNASWVGSFEIGYNNNRGALLDVQRRRYRGLHAGRGCRHHRPHGRRRGKHLQAKRRPRGRRRRHADRHHSQHGKRCLSATTGHVTSDDPRLKLNSGALAFPATDPGQSVSASLNVSLAPGTDAVTPAVTITVSDPDFALAESATFTSRIRLNVDDEPKQSATDDFESGRTAWDVPTNNQWSILDLSSTQRVWHGSDHFAQTDASLTSPLLTVARDRPLRIVFHHRYWFNFATATNGDLVPLDGGVVELSTHDGITWIDIGESASPGYDAPIFADPLNPLAGRRAFGGLSPGASFESPSTSPFTTAIIDLGTKYAGQRVRIRFRIGTGNTTALPLGWQIDDVAVNGITNLPFHALVADRGLCSTSSSTTELRAIGGLLQATVSSMLATPNGAVEFFENGKTVGAAPLVNGVATWNPSTFLAPGTHTITAGFGGSTNFTASSSAPATITIAHRRAGALHDSSTDPSPVQRRVSRVSALTERAPTTTRNALQPIHQRSESEGPRTAR
jgi:hypothetical protein